MHHQKQWKKKTGFSRSFGKLSYNFIELHWKCWFQGLITLSKMFNRQISEQIRWCRDQIMFFFFQIEKASLSASMGCWQVCFWFFSFRLIPTKFYPYKYNYDDMGGGLIKDYLYSRWYSCQENKYRYGRAAVGKDIWWSS